MSYYHPDGGNIIHLPASTHTGYASNRINNNNLNHFHHPRIGSTAAAANPRITSTTTTVATTTPSNIRGTSGGIGARLHHYNHHHAASAAVSAPPVYYGSMLLYSSTTVSPDSGNHSVESSSSSSRMISPATTTIPTIPFNSTITPAPVGINSGADPSTTSASLLEAGELFLVTPQTTIGTTTGSSATTMTTSATTATMTPMSRRAKPDLGVVVSIASFLGLVRLFQAMFYSSALGNLEGGIMKDVLLVMFVFIPSMTLACFYFRTEEHFWNASNTMMPMRFTNTANRR